MHAPNVHNNSAALLIHTQCVYTCVYMHVYPIPLCIYYVDACTSTTHAHLHTCTCMYSCTVGEDYLHIMTSKCHAIDLTSLSIILSLMIL